MSPIQAYSVQKTQDLLSSGQFWIDSSKIKNLKF